MAANCPMSGHGVPHSRDYVDNVRARCWMCERIIQVNRSGAFRKHQDPAPCRNGHRWTVYTATARCGCGEIAWGERPSLQMGGHSDGG
jgi:hypothetical protein